MQRDRLQSAVTRANVLDAMLFAAAILLAVAIPPQLHFETQPLLTGLALCVCLALAGWPVPARWRPATRGAAVLGCWLVVAWAILSQPASLTLPDAIIWGTRALTLLAGALSWAWLRWPLGLVRQALIGAGLPLVLASGLVVALSPSRSLTFRPQYIAVAPSGMVYITDHESPVIRVFAPDGALLGKIRPGLASVQGPPGPGMFPSGPYNDPDRLGITLTRSGKLTRVAVQPWPVGTDDFWFSGLSTDASGALYVPDWMRARLLRFAPDGRLLSSWPLAAGFTPTLGCIAWGGGHLYLADTRGLVSQLEPATGQVERTWSLSAPVTGGVAWDASQQKVVMLGMRALYALDPATGRISAHALPDITTSLARPFESVAVLADGRAVLADLADHRVLVEGGTPLRTGEPGQPVTVASDLAGNLYVADTQLRAVERYDVRGHLTATYRAADDDEKD